MDATSAIRTPPAPGAGSAANPLVDSILDGSAPRPMRVAAARGALPLSRPDLFRLLVALSADDDEEIRSLAGRTIEGWPRDEIQQLGSEPGTDGAILAFLLAWPGMDPSLLPGVLSNPSTPIEALRSAARAFPAERIDALLLNQTLLIQNPELLEEIEANPNAAPLHRNRVDEIRRHFLAGEPSARKAPSTEAPAPPELLKPGASVPSANSSPAPEAMPKPRVEPPASIDQVAVPASEDVSLNVMMRIMGLTVGEKIQVAFKGTREERSILIRDTNRSVQEAVLSSPKLTESEVDAIARMRNVSEEVLRRLAANRDWVKAYSVVQGIATNPKTPLGISLKLVSRLNTRDLKTLQNDKNVPEALRRAAAKAVQMRITGGGGGPRGH